MSELLESRVRGELAAAADGVTTEEQWQDALVTRVGDRATRFRHRQAAVTVTCLSVVLVLGLLAWAGSGGARQVPAPVVDVPPRVDIGGRFLAVHCRGPVRAEAPTVIVEAALGASAAAYEPTVAALAGRYRVCTYDRAGTGLSDAADRLPRTAQDLAGDLADLVASGKLGDKVVLLGDGSGALSASLLATQHPDLVVGLVLLDPQGPDAAGRQRRALGAREPGEPALVRDLRRAFDSDQRSQNGERLDLVASERQVAESLVGGSPAWGDVPVAVLVPGDRADRVPRLPAAMRATWVRAIREDAIRLAAESERGSLSVVAGTSGALAATAPDEVVMAVESVVEAAR